MLTALHTALAAVLCERVNHKACKACGPCSQLRISVSLEDSPSAPASRLELTLID